MKSRWQTIKLGEVCDVIAGQSPLGKYYNNAGNGLPFYQGKKEFREKFINEPTTWTTSVTKEAHKDDILMSVRAPVGPINFSTGIICIGRGLAAIRVSKLIDKEFLFYFLLKHEGEIIGNSGAVFNSISRTQIENILIPLPPLREQQCIVSTLDKALATIDKAKFNTEQNLKNTKELFENYLQAMLENIGENWEEKTLGDVCSLITDGKHGDCENEANSGYYFLSAKDVRNNTLLFDNARQITKGGFEETHRRTNLKPGDICMVNTGATIGRISFAPDDPRTYKSTFQKSVAIIKTIPSLIDNYYCCYLLQADLKKLVKISSGTAVPNLLLGDLKRHRINLPKTLKIQKEIVKKLNNLSSETKKLEVIYRAKINKLDEQKKSILQKAFSGKLTKKNINIDAKVRA